MSQGLIPDLPRDPHIFLPDGSLNAVWSLFFDQLILTILTYLSNEGFTIPQKSSTNIDILTAIQSLGAILYNNTLNNFQGNVINPDVTPEPTQSWVSFAMIVRGLGSPIGSVAGVINTFYWDTVGNALYYCTSTGSASSAIWIAV